MSYEFYKLLHIVSLIFVISSVTFNVSTSTPRPIIKIFSMISSLFLFVAGMGLLARTGSSHGEGWPLWVQLKILIWMVLAIGGPLGIKYLPQRKVQILGGILVLMVVAISLVVLKPFT